MTKIQHLETEGQKRRPIGNGILKGQEHNAGRNQTQSQCLAKENSTNTSTSLHTCTHMHPHVRTHTGFG